MLSSGQKPEQEEVKRWEGTVIYFLAVRTTSPSRSFIVFSKIVLVFVFVFPLSLSHEKLEWGGGV